MKRIGRKRRHKRVTKKIKGTQDKPRLVVFRSKKHIYAQLINDQLQKAVTGCSTLGKDFSATEKTKTSNKEAAKKLGIIIAKKALGLGVTTISFDRGGYKYHGRVKSLADGAREGGLKF